MSNVIAFPMREPPDASPETDGDVTADIERQIAQLCRDAPGTRVEIVDDSAPLSTLAYVWHGYEDTAPLLVAFIYSPVRERMRQTLH